MWADVFLLLVDGSIKKKCNIENLVRSGGAANSCF